MVGRVADEVVLSDEERTFLEAQVRRHKAARSLSDRCRMILLCTEGLQSKEVAERLGVHEHTVGKWRRRFVKDRIEGLDPVLEAALAGDRDEMLEVMIDPLRMEAYNVTAAELVSAVTQNNLLIAAGEVQTDQGSFAVKIPATLQSQQDVYAIKIVGDGDRSVTLGDLAEIRLTYEDREGTARFNGISTVALQVVKKKGYNLIDTADLVRAEVADAQQDWPEELQAAITVGTSNDQSFTVKSMVSQLEGSVLTAIAGRRCQHR